MCDMCYAERAPSVNTSNTAAAVSTKRKKTSAPQSPPSPTSTSPPTKNAFNVLMARPPNPNPNKEPPGMFTIGVRRNAAPDKEGKRSISEEDYIAQLRRYNAEYVFDLRSGRGATACKQNTINFPGNGNATRLCGNPSKPNFMCECKIEAVHKRAGIGYEWAGKPVSKTGEDSYTGTNLGGSRVSLAFNDYMGKPESNWGTIRRAKYNPENVRGCNCPEKEGGMKTTFEKFDPVMHAALQRIFNMAQEKRVVLLCVEDELHKVSATSLDMDEHIFIDIDITYRETWVN